ncbi:MAG TPA: hypothetical protein VMB50_22290 [Myxococcales bacterium]|nr:hypothetical protein [Myxococcales bacterium]
MKFTLIVCYETDLAKVVQEVEAAGATSYTFLSRLLGRGETGRRLGTEAFLGFNSALLVGCEPVVAEQIRGRLLALRRRRKRGLHAFSWEAEQWL